MQLPNYFRHSIENRSIRRAIGASFKLAPEASSVLDKEVVSLETALMPYWQDGTRGPNKLDSSYIKNLLWL